LELSLLVALPHCPLVQPKRLFSFENALPLFPMPIEAVFDIAQFLSERFVLVFKRLLPLFEQFPISTGGIGPQFTIDHSEFCFPVLLQKGIILDDSDVIDFSAFFSEAGIDAARASLSEEGMTTAHLLR
jgi:hypothetical protein